MAALGFVVSILWTAYLTVTRSRWVPDHGIEWAEWSRQHGRLVADDGWRGALWNLLTHGLASALAIIFGFVLAAMMTARSGMRASSARWSFAASLIVTGVAWRWVLNPRMGLEATLRRPGWDRASFNRLGQPDTAMYDIILALIRQSAGVCMALMIAGLKGIDGEIRSAARLDRAGLRRLYSEILSP